MNPLAKELNTLLEGTIIADMMSDYGRRMYFPKGIISQSAEAKQKAHRYNATIGIATEKSEALHIPSVYSGFNGTLAVNEVFPYAPTAGEISLRTVWLEEMIRKNPAMKGKKTSLPVVTNGLTHAISIAFSLFLDEGDEILVPDFYWGNYNLIIDEQRKAVNIPFALFADGALNVEGLSQAIDSASGDKIALILNFPNNPTGYTPTISEAQALVKMLTAKAEGGKKLLVFSDDAYFGLFFEEDVCRQSLFALLCDAHENILAVKGDAATKEEMVWGFRVGFLTFNSAGLTEEHYEALVKKTMGAIRGNVSSCSKPAQSLLLKAMKSPSYLEEKAEGISKIKDRYVVMKEALTSHEGDDNLIPLPFNSGYFMSFTCKGDAEQLRLHLLDTYGVGTISIKGKYLRLAFSSTDIEDIRDLVDIVYKGAEEIFTN